MTDLLNLAARVEAAETTEFELLLLSWEAVHGTRHEILKQADHQVEEWTYARRCFVDLLTAGGSLDAAMTLVPEDYRLSSFGEEAYDDEARPWVANLSARAGRFGSMGKYARAATPALALVAACLKARAAQ